MEIGNRGRDLSSSSVWKSYNGMESAETNALGRFLLEIRMKNGGLET